MKNIKEIFKNLLGDQKKILKKYILTFLMIFITTLFMVFIGFEIENINEFYTVLLLTNILVFVIESLSNFKWYRIPMYIFAFAISIIAKGFIFAEEFTTKQGLFIFGLYASSIFIAIYKIIKDSNITFSQYISRIFNNNIILGIASSVLEIGISFVVFTMMELLFKDANIDFFFKFQILLLGLFIIPGEILCLLNIKQEVLKPTQILICYILLPLVTFAELIIFIYFIKILIIQEIPSNTVFPIISALFIFACPTWIMINNFKEKNKYINLNTKIIPFSFIPLIGMQIYAVGIRIFEMGLTPERYLGVSLIIFEIITVILTLVKNQKYLNTLLLSAVGIILIITCIPGINVVDFSWESQLFRLNSAYNKASSFDELSQEEKGKVISAYNYLKYDDEGSKHIPNYIDTSALSEYENSSNMSDKIIKDYSDIYYNSNTNEISIEGFKKVIPINYTKYYYEETEINKIDFDTFKVYKENELNEQIIDSLKVFIQISLNKNSINSHVIDINENTRFLITNIHINYIKNTQEVSNISINGYMLMK